MRNKVNAKMIELYVSAMTAKRALEAKLKDNSGTGMTEQGAMIAGAVVLVLFAVGALYTIFKDKMEPGVSSTIDSLFSFI